MGNWVHGWTGWFGSAGLKLCGWGVSMCMYVNMQVCVCVCVLYGLISLGYLCT